MTIQLKVLIVVIGIAYGFICIYRPVWIALVIAKFVKFGLGEIWSSSNHKLRDIITLIERNGNEYVRAYPDHISRIKITGATALFVSFMGACMLVYNS